MSLNEKELLPCPHCGNADVRAGTDKDEFENTRFSVKCWKCQAEMGWMVDAQPWGDDLDALKAKTIAAWNRRASATSSGAVAGIVERLMREAREASRISRMIAEAKSLRQGGNTEGRTDLYMWLQPDQTTAGQAASALTRLAARAETAEAEATTLRKELERAKEVIAPFAQFGADNTDDEGWGGNRCEGERIRDWFGPSDFRAAREWLEGK